MTSKLEERQEPVFVTRKRAHSIKASFWRHFWLLSKEKLRYNGLVLLSVFSTLPSKIFVLSPLSNCCYFHRKKINLDVRSIIDSLISKKSTFVLKEGLFLIVIKTFWSFFKVRLPPSLWKTVSQKVSELGSI